MGEIRSTRSLTDWHVNSPSASPSGSKLYRMPGKSRGTLADRRSLHPMYVCSLPKCADPWSNLIYRYTVHTFKTRKQKGHFSCLEKWPFCFGYYEMLENWA